MKITKEHRTVLLRGIFAGILILAAAFGKLLVRHDPYQVNMRAAFQKPGGEYLFGTDNLGRCVFCRIVTGSRTSLFSALLVILIVFVVGTLIGAAAGYMGGLADEILMKTALIFQAQWREFWAWACETVFWPCVLCTGPLTRSLPEAWW